MIIKSNKDFYGEMPYQMNYNNVTEIINEIDFDSFKKEYAEQEKDSAHELYKKLFSVFQKEKSDWGKKDVYLSFEEIGEVIKTVFQCFNIDVNEVKESKNSV